MPELPDIETYLMALRPPRGGTAPRADSSCAVCSQPVQRIVRGDHETNYCASCPTGGKLLADRALSRLLRSDWPKTLEALEGLKRPR